MHLATGRLTHIGLGLSPELLEQTRPSPAGPKGCGLVPREAARPYSYLK